MWFQLAVQGGWVGKEETGIRGSSLHWIAMLLYTCACMP